MDVLSICYRFTWNACFCRCEFLMYMFQKVFIQTFYYKPSFRFLICGLVLTFRRYSVNITISCSIYMRWWNWYWYWCKCNHRKFLLVHMSQIDQLIYLPLLIWFIIFSLLFYSIILWLIVPLIYWILLIRSKFFRTIKINSKNLLLILLTLYHRKS